MSILGYAAESALSDCKCFGRHEENKSTQSDMPEIISGFLLNNITIKIKHLCSPNALTEQHLSRLAILGQ